MSVSPMKLVTIAGPLAAFDMAVRSCVINREFHPESAMSVMQKVKGLYPFDLENPYTALLRRAQTVSDKTGIPLDYREFPADSYSAEDTAAYFSRIDQRFTEVLAEISGLQARLEENKQLLMQLSHVQGVSVPLEEFFSLTYVKFRFGRMPREVYASFYPHIIDRQDVFFFKTNQDHDYVYGLYMTPRAHAENIDSLFASLRFERLQLSKRLRGSGAEAVRLISEDTLAAGLRLAELEAELERLRRDEGAEFLRCYSFVRYMNDSHDLRRYAAHTGESFYLMGWVPEADFGGFSENLRQYENLDFVVVADGPEALSDYVPPVKLRNAVLFRPFEPFVSMYGLPSYNEFDPTPMMAVIYSLLFGVMFGDVGHGLLIVLTGLYMWRGRGMWLGRCLMYAGVCSIAFGLVYGSVFGSEELLPFGFPVLHESQAILTFSIYGGAGLVCLAILMNIVNGIRQKSFEKTLFGQNALAGMFLYIGIMAVVLPFLGFGGALVSPRLAVPVILASLLLVFIREPLTRLCEKSKDWKPHEGAAGFIVSNFFEMFEVLLSFLSNTLSFLRVGAFAISHAAMMTVVYALAEQSGGGYYPVLILGNLFVAGIEGLLVGIQVLRLNFYELFGRFYSGAGRPYAPIVIDYKSRKE